MAGLEGLASIIYHEKQQSGSMLCAQHALNSLLQGPYYTAPDLSEIARNLDVLEAQYNTDSEQGESKNMDDTGFFSVQVIEEAIRLWGLNLVRWRSNAMRPYQDRPHTQLAFILNFQQHWFTLRRFGPASANIDDDAGQGHWFNLNSFLPAPEWVGKLYLGMVLQQAETEGYSVFAVTQADPSKPLALARTEADTVAATLPEPSSASQSSVYNATKRNPDTSETPAKPSVNERSPDSTDDFDPVEGIEDEDYELQAALQASLARQDGYGSHRYVPTSSNLPTIPPALVDAASSSRTYSSTASRSVSTNSGSQSPRPLNIPGHVVLDPVAASMERNRVLLQRMREQQELAQRELWSANELTPEERAAQEARIQARRQQEEQEEEELRKAIAESEAMAREWDEQQKSRSNSDKPPSADGKGCSSSHWLLQPDVAGSASLRHLGEEHRNYDDEDAELQAALKASLENVPPGWQHSELPPPPAPRHRPSSNLPRGSAPNAESSGVAGKRSEKDTQKSMDVDEDEQWHSESEAADNDADVSARDGAPALEEQNAPPSLDEIRKARLARFGL